MSLWLRLKYLLPSRRRREEREMHDELESLRAIAGARELGNVVQVAERAREEWTWTPLERVRQDVHYAWRTFRRRKAFTLVAALTLAIGIGANVAVFSQVNAVFFKTLPVENPQQLHVLSWTSARRAFARGAFMNASWVARLAAGETIPTFSYAVYLSMRDRITRFSDLACWSAGATGALTEWGPVTVESVSGNYFRTVGVTPVVGRSIEPSDDQAGARPVAVISYGLWQRAFGGDSNVLHKAISIRGSSFAVIGVMPDAFGGLNPAARRDVIAPYAARGLLTPVGLNPRSWGGCQIIGRVRNGVAVEEARAEAE